MAFKRTLAQRLFNISRISHQTLTACRISSSAAAVIDPLDESIFRRFLQRRRLYQSSTAVLELLSLPTGGKLVERLRGMDIVRDRIRLDGLNPPATVMDSPEGKMTMEDARKLLKVAQLEMVKSKLRRIEKNCVLKAIQGLMPVPIAYSEDPRRKELEELEQQKSIIDKKAESMVRRELWCGLGYLVIQTAAFMRLTFWELSWDVMEPICFYVTSMYFMAGYAFFLRTAKEPSFEGFFQSRFSAKQKKLMKVNNFDLGRYSELRKACYPYSWPREQIFSFTPSKSNNNSESMENVPFAKDYNLR